MSRRRNGQVFGARSVGSQAQQRVHRLNGRNRRRDEGGQALIELVVVLPLVALLLGVAFNGWSGMQLALRLTSAARAGAIQAANELGSTTPPPTPTVLNDATKAINAEEGVAGVYQNSNSAANDYVSMSQSQTTSSGVTMNVVTITISQRSGSLVPFVGTFPVTVHATARYS